MYPRLKDHVPKPKEKYELSFVVDLIEDLRGTQKEMERSIMELRQRLPVPVMNQPQSAAAVNQQPIPPPQTLPQWWNISQFVPPAPSCY